MTLRTLLISLAVTAGSVSAQSMAPNGSFGFLLTDFFVDNGSGNGAAILGLMNFDGAGNITGTHTFRGRGGPNDAGNGTLTGTYSSNPDGTGSASVSIDIGVTLTFATVVTDSGQGLQLIVTKCAPISCNIGGGVVHLQGTAQSVNGSLPMSLADGGANGGIPLTLTGVTNATAGTTVYTAAAATGSGTAQCPDGSSGMWNALVPSLTVAVGPPGAARFLLALSYQYCGNPNSILLSGTVDGGINSNGAANLNLHSPGEVLSSVARVSAPGQTMNGSYGYQSGFAPYPRGEIGVIKFDGAGNVTISSTSVADGSSHGSGQPVVTGTGMGTYTLNPDGTGTMSVQGFGKLAFVVTDNGSRLLFLRLATTNENDLQFGTAQLQ